MLSEPLLAICLGLFSAVTLATANMSVKMGSDILVGRAILSASSALLIAPAALFVPLPDARLWGALLLTIPAHYAYQLCLIRALQRGDLSLVFPVMRGAAPLLTAVTALLLLGEHLAPWAWLGLLVATGALILFALPPRGVLLRHHPDRAALGWAAATALGIAFYNTLDARGRSDAERAKILADAVAVSDAGAFLLVVEGVLEEIGAEVTRNVACPTIGIGASASCDGQVLVTEDMLGLFERTPRFVKRYDDWAGRVEAAAVAYAADVRARRFPTEEQIYRPAKGST